MGSKKRKLEDIYDEVPKGRQPLTKRRKVPLYELTQYLQAQIAMSHAHEPQRRRPDLMKKTQQKAKSILTNRMTITLEKQALVIFLRFGSLNSD
jgi:hypothetical protein